MKKNFLIVFLLSVHFAYAKIGTTNDGFFLILAICAILFFILVVLYSIDLIRKKIKQRKEMKIIDAMDNSNNENISEEVL